MPIDLFSLHHPPASEVMLMLYAVEKPVLFIVKETETLSPSVSDTCVVDASWADTSTAVLP